MTTYIQLTQQLHNAFSNADYDAVLALVADDIETVSYSNGYQSKGKDGFRTFFMGFASAFPDITITHRNIIASGDWVAVEFGATGTNTGTLMTPNGAAPPTGRKVEFNVCEVHEWKDGKLTRLVNYQDAMSLMAQLGLLPQPAGL
ncbi:MAG: hypothetical protein KatS3mg053_2912 [Candidatus Roseilinea sp.]|nr:MAG: hypothetical protein KatS3mg053_2912 [Candidatus Roseilinea sp.]